MNKGELIESVRHHLKKREVTKALAAEAVEGVLAAIHHSLSTSRSSVSVIFPYRSVPRVMGAIRRPARTSRSLLRTPSGSSRAPP
jgi:hypothetical protein